MLTEAIIVNLFLVLAIRFYQYRARLTLFSSDLWLAILVVSLVPTIFGINLLLFTDAEVSFGAQSVLSEKIMRTVYIEYYLSWIILFFLMGAARSFLIIPERRSSFEQFQKISYSPRLYLFIAISTIGLLCADLLMMESWPGLSGFFGDLSGAQESKGAFINEKMRNSIPLVGYLIRFLPNFAVAILFERYFRERKSFLFWLLISFFLLYTFLTLIKSFLLNAVVVCIIVFLLHTRKKINFWLVLKFGSLAIMSAFLPFAVLMGGDTMQVLGNILRRIFIVQIEGAFLIREIYTEVRLDALLEGFPLLARFGFETFDPARGVIREVFGESHSGWVNMNSHFVGQGFVMFGPLIGIIGPIILVLNFAILNLLSRTFPLGPRQHLSSAIVLACALFVPINNNFGNAVYFKSIIAYVIMYAFLKFLMQLSRLRIFTAKRPLSGISE